MTTASQRPHDRLRTLALVIAAGLASALAAPSTLRADEPPPPTMASLVADLGAPDIIKRETALRILTEDASITLRQLEEALRSPETKLSPEQRFRLMDAAHERFAQSPRPALGVRFDFALQDRVVIDQVYKNFPASAELQVGDMIVAAEGEKLRSRSAWVRLGAHIIAKEPGESLQLTIRRGAEKLDLMVPLGKYTDLGDASRPDENRLERAWELRSNPYAPQASRPVIDPKVPATVWQPEASPIEAAKMNRFRAQLPKMNAMHVVAGGEARGGALDYDELTILAQQNPRMNQAAARLWNQQQLAVQNGFDGGVTRSVQQELADLEQRKASMERAIERRSIPDQNRPGQMVADEVALTRARDEVRRLQKLIDAINAEAREEKPAEAAHVGESK